MKMPPNLRNVPGQDIRMSFADVFKSSKVLKAERDMVARKVRLVHQHDSTSHWQLTQTNSESS